MCELTQKRLKEYLIYDESTGVFIWNKPNPLSKKIRKGDVAGSLSVDGYWLIGIDKKTFRAHRLAWLYVHGKMPSGVIDHIDHNKLNNKLNNLRDVYCGVNRQNLTNDSSYGTSKYIGVSFDRSRGTWRSAITTMGVKKYIGRFSTEKEAYQAYVQAKRILHEGCTI